LIDIPVHSPELESEEWRSKNGFTGRDFIHSPTAHVRILDYILVLAASSDTSESNSNSKFPRLVGPVQFTSGAESHKGLCHGGSMCAVMDDALGWMGFCADGTVRPWSGYTVQVNTSLRKSVSVGSMLKIEAWVDRFEGIRKIWVKAILKDPNDGTIYCEGDGLFLKSSQ